MRAFASLRWASAVAALVASACAGPSGSEDGEDADAAPAAADAGPPAACGDADGLPGFAAPAPAGGLVATCATVELVATPLADGTLRLVYRAPGASHTPHPWHGTTPPPPAPAALGRAGERAAICSADFVVLVDDACRARVSDASGAVLVDDLLASPSLVRRIAPAGERYYGFGEKTGRLDKRGRRMTFWNTDAYDPALGGWRADQDPLYASIPFFIALRAGRAHGVFIDDTHRLRVDMADGDGAVYELASDGPRLEQYVVAGPAMREVLRRYTALTGRTPRPPRWALGFHQSRWGYHTAAEVEAVAAELRARAIPADGLWLDIQHLDGHRTFTWDPGRFADPEGLLARLAALGFKVTVIADPGLKQDPGWPVYDQGLAGDHFLRRPDGYLYVGQAWPGASVFPDFTRAETRAFWGAHVAALAARGVSGIWLDVNEPTTFPEGGSGTSVPDDVPVSAGATTMAEVHNDYARLEATATWDALAAAHPERRPFVLSRAGSPGIQRVAALWTGDAVSSFAGLGQQLPMLLGLGLSGVPFVGSDVGGYSGHASAELYARWMSLGAISPFFRAHVTIGVPGQEPWRFGPEVLDVSRALIRERYARLPYLESLMAEAAATGTPPLRPMIFEFQEDLQLETVDDQAMLGPFLLVAPVATAGASTREIRLPAGRWYEERSAAAYDGPATIAVDVAPLAAAPTLVRAGAILPRAPVGTHTADAPTDALFLDVYPSSAASSFTLVEDSGDGFADPARTTYSLLALSDGARLTATRAGAHAPPPRTLHVRVRRVDAGRGAMALLDGQPIPVTHDAADNSLTISFPDRPAFDLRVFYDPALVSLAPPLSLPVEVTLPAGTPEDTPITIATSASGWTHQPLERTGPTTARGTIVVPRGAFFYYKYARGTWATVETYADGSEAANRYRFGAAGPIADQVAAWR